MWFAVGLLAVPLIEIGLFVIVGGYLGLWLTLLLVVVSGLTGVLVIRWQGTRAIDGLRETVRRHRNPVGQVAEGALVVVAGLLLVLPGFLTDVLGLLLLLPAVRKILFRSLAARVRGHAAERQDRAWRSDADVIDGEFFEARQDQPDNRLPVPPPIGPTRH